MAVGRKIDDGQAPMAEPDGPIGPNTGIVRSPAPQALDTLCEDFGRRQTPAAVKNADDSAH